MLQVTLVAVGVLTLPAVVWAAVTARRCPHPDHAVALGPPDRHDWHVAYCTRCSARWATHDRRISRRFLASLRATGGHEQADRIERANDVYEAKRRRYETDVG